MLLVISVEVTRDACVVLNPFPAMTGGFNPGESEAYKNIFYI